MIESPTPEKASSTFQFKDMFGFGEIISKLSLNKLTPIMTFCVVFGLAILMFIGGMYAYKNYKGFSEAHFPNSWDMRITLITVVIIFAVGVWDYRNRRK